VPVLSSPLPEVDEVEVQLEAVELEKKLLDLNFSTVNLTGLSFNPIFQEWKRSKDLSVNYILATEKN